jgi:predicted helicase
LYPLLNRIGAQALVASDNFRPTVLPRLSAAYGILVGPEELFAYLAGILMSQRYTEEFEARLGADHPRIPITLENGLFRDIAQLGNVLINAQTLQIADNAFTSRLEGDGRQRLAAARYDPANNQLYLNDLLWLTNISQGVWRYRMGQHYVLERYLEDRVGRILSASDISELLRVVTALQITLQVQPQLDAAVDACLSGHCFLATDFSA